jgi:predicted phosphodiesterase
MRVAILTDIHANLPALEAVLDACTPYDAVWVMGDVVGYGPYPDDVVARLRKEQAVAVRGNHDAAVLGDLDTSVFNEDARLAVDWTAERIGTATRHWLEGLPETRVEDGFTLAHGSPRDPLWEYLITVPLARRNFAHFETRHAIVGHTHVPRVYRDDGGHIEVIAPGEGSRIVLDERRCILNPGGVGQPRDGDPRACAMVLDTETSTIEWLRVAYPVERVQARMRRAGLPPRLVERLAHGL